MARCPEEVKSEMNKIAGSMFPSPIGCNTLKAPHCIFLGDCLDVLTKQIPANSIDLVITSPPYADQRKSNYGGVHPDDYVDWFSPRAEKIKHVFEAYGFIHSKHKGKGVKGRKTSLRSEFDSRDERARLALDGGIYLAQKELLLRQMA